VILNCCFAFIPSVRVPPRPSLCINFCVFDPHLSGWGCWIVCQVRPHLLPPSPRHLRGGGLHLVFVGQLNFPLLLQEARLLYLVKILERCTQGNNKGAHRETTKVLTGKQQKCTQQRTRGSVMVTQGTNHWTQGKEHMTQMGDNSKCSFFTSGFGTESKSSSK